MNQDKAEFFFNSFTQNEWKADQNYSAIRATGWKTFDGIEVQAFTRKGKRFIMWSPTSSPDGFPTSTWAID